MPELESAEQVEATRIAELTPREREVFRLIARAYSNAEIAEAFVISEGTVKTHVKRLLGSSASATEPRRSCSRTRWDS